MRHISAVFRSAKMKIRGRLYVKFEFQSCPTKLVLVAMKGKARLSRCSLCRPPYAYLATSGQCVYVLFLFTRRRKEDPIKGKGRAVSVFLFFLPPKSRRDGEGDREERKRGRKKTKKVPRDCIDF